MARWRRETAKSKFVFPDNGSADGKAQNMCVCVFLIVMYTYIYVYFFSNRGVGRWEVLARESLVEEVASTYK